jgi:hypothetical protein
MLILDKLRWRHVLGVILEDLFVSLWVTTSTAYREVLQFDGYLTTDSQTHTRARTCAHTHMVGEKCCEFWTS